MIDGIDGNAIFDENGVAVFDAAATLSRQSDGRYHLDVDVLLTKDELYNLGLALARLADVK